MKKSKKLLLFCAFAILSVCLYMNFTRQTVYAGKSNAELQSEINALTGKKSQIDKDTKALKDKINNAKASAGTLSAEISQLKYQIDLIDEQLIIVEKLIAEYEALTAEQAVQITSLEAEIVKQQRMIDDMIRMSFEYGGVGSTAEFIFSAENFSDMISRVDLLGYHLSYNDNVLENFNNTLADLEKTKAEYEKAKTEMEIYKSEQVVLREQLSTAEKEAEEKRATLLADADGYEKELAEKEKAIADINSEIKNLAAMFAKEDKTTYSGIFAFPLPSGTYRITSYYGYRKDPITGKTAYHNGYDFAAPKGTSIYAVDDGTVAIAKYNQSGYGNYITINHGGGVMSLYGHCSSLNVTSGQKVKRGDVIGYVGSTGRSTGNHLHFTVYKNGELVDPANYVTIK